MYVVDPCRLLQDIQDVCYMSVVWQQLGLSWIIHSEITVLSHQRLLTEFVGYLLAQDNCFAHHNVDIVLNFF